MLKDLRHLAFITTVLVFQPPPSIAQNYVYQPGQLDELLAPVALYPDSLIGQLLSASQYPDQIRDATMWLNDPAHAVWGNDQLLYSLQHAPWDPSVKSLTALPQLLRTLNDNLSWAESIGNAYAQQPDDVVAAIQDLRRDAREAGNLYSSPHTTIYEQEGAIYIEPAVENQIYVPSYNPALVYGAWTYSEYPPYSFAHTAYVASFPQNAYVSITDVQPFYSVHAHDWRHGHYDHTDHDYYDLRFSPTVPHGTGFPHPSNPAPFNPGGPALTAFNPGGSTSHHFNPGGPSQNRLVVSPQTAPSAPVTPVSPLPTDAPLAPVAVPLATSPTLVQSPAGQSTTLPEHLGHEHPLPDHRPEAAFRSPDATSAVIVSPVTAPVAPPVAAPIMAPVINVQPAMHPVVQPAIQPMAPVVPSAASPAVSGRTDPPVPQTTH